MRREEQWFDALGRANAVRSTMKEYKARLGALPRPDALRDAAVTVAAPSAALGRLKVVDLLRAIPGMGRIRAERLMRSCLIEATRRVDELTPQRRSALLRVLHDEARRVERDRSRRRRGGGQVDGELRAAA